MDPTIHGPRNAEGGVLPATWNSQTPWAALHHMVGIVRQTEGAARNIRLVAEVRLPWDRHLLSFVCSLYPRLT